jgi:hypothetical protein
MGSTDAAHVLRPAGTLNHKSSPPAPVVALRVEWDVHDADRVAAHLPDPPEPERCPGEYVVGDHDDPLRTVPADVYVPLLTGREVGRDRKARCPFHGGGEERTPSLHVYATSWTCFGCDPRPGAGRDRLGGDVYTLAALVWEFALPVRGRDFIELRRRLGAALLGQESTA